VLCSSEELPKGAYSTERWGLVRTAPNGSLATGCACCQMFARRCDAIGFGILKPVGNPRSQEKTT